MAGDRSVQIGGNAAGVVIVAGDHNRTTAQVTVSQPADAAGVDIAKELAAIRAILASLGSEHAGKIGRALDDADEEAAKRGDKSELGKALERALSYAKSASGFASIAAKLGPPVKTVVAWLGDQWSTLLSHLG